jgi:general secretion pathway protein J
MKSAQKGFTLIEVLLAVTITAILLVTVYGVFTSVSNARNRIEAEGEGYHLARVIFDRIGREIRGAYYLKGNKKTTFKGGIDEERNPFLLLSTTATTPQGERQEGVALVRYRLRKDEQAEDKRVLTRSEEPLIQGTQTPREYRLAPGIEALQLRFSDGDNWQESWDSDSLNAVPKMIEVALEIRLDGTVVPFRSIFEVPTLEAAP